MIRRILLGVSLLGLSACGTDNSDLGRLNLDESRSILCPTYLNDQDLPAVEQFVPGTFRHSFNKVMALTLKQQPFHFAKDLILQEGQSGVMQAKFDYGVLVHKDLEDEDVEAYLWNPSRGSWTYMTTLTTDYDGKVYLPIQDLAAGEYPVRFIVKGDGSEASGRITVTQAGGAAVIFDLDSTLTTNDLEAVSDYLNIKNAKLRPHAVELVRTYESLGYRIIYLTSRPYILIPSTQSWLEAVGLPRGHLYSPVYIEDSLNVGWHGVFKAEYINYLQNAAGLEIVAAYGNAKTDIEAYEEAGIHKDFTFITGSLAGTEGTVAVPDYGPHISWVKQNFSASQCRQLLTTAAM